MTVTNPDMTRFLMHLSEAVELVLHAFTSGSQGDLFVKKSPASTIGVLAQAIQELFGVGNDVQVIGTRHGEKLYETLVNREEMLRAEDQGEYFRIPADSRDLNYGKYFDVGEQAIGSYEDYTSHNTERLDVERTKELLRTLKVIQEAQRA